MSHYYDPMSQQALLAERDDERIPYVLIAERWQKARKARLCDQGRHQIEQGETYVRRFGLSDGEPFDFSVCLWCEHYEDRPTS